MKTQGMSHQLEAIRRSNGREFFAYLMEQGTGKTWATLADAERAYAAGTIEGLLVFAPKGVHTNWIKREIPTHLECEWTGGAWSSGLGKRARALLESRLFAPREEGEVPPLRILAMNTDALITDDGFTMAMRFANAVKCMVVVDESSDIKNITTARSKRVLRLKPRAVLRRILNGTPITNAPADAFGQFEFLEEGLLGTTSYRSFFAEFAELMPMDKKSLEERGDWAMLQRLRRNPKLHGAQIVLKDEEGQPRWRNLDKLRSLIEPHSYRVLKKDCLDLPEKVYQTQFFELTAHQRAEYRRLIDEARVHLEDEVYVFTPLAVLTKLQQVTSGFVMIDGEPHGLSPELATPRLEALAGIVERTEGKLIVWAKFTEELVMIADCLRAAGISFVEYRGQTKSADRERAVEEFQNGEARVFLGQPRAGGIGLTLTAAETVVYYSNDFNLRTRLQSEDRAHRIGTTVHVVYIDIVAENTIDEAIARALQRKAEVAAEILGDEPALRFDAWSVAHDGDEEPNVVDVYEAGQSAGDVVITASIAPAFVDVADSAASHAEWRPR